MEGRRLAKAMGFAKDPTMEIVARSPRAGKGEALPRPRPQAGPFAPSRWQHETG